MATGTTGGSRESRPDGNGVRHRGLSGPVVRRGLRVSLVVGTVLTAINEGPTVVAGHPDLSLLPRAVLNYVVPFCVSSYSAVAAARAFRRHPGVEGPESKPVHPPCHTTAAAEPPGVDDAVR